MPMGAAPMAWSLWSRHLRHDPSAPDWADRDRFVLSAGHGSMLNAENAITIAALYLGQNKMFGCQAAKNFAQRGDADRIALLGALQLDLRAGRQRARNDVFADFPENDIADGLGCLGGGLQHGIS